LASVPAFALLAGLGVSPAGLGAATVAVIGVVALVVAGQVAERGRTLQGTLFDRWGGAPTTCALSLVQSTEPDRVRARRASVERFGELRLPILEDEREDPVRARIALDDAVARVRARLREDETNRILADANADYGFRRNCLAIRRAGICVSIASAVAGCALWAASAGGHPAGYLPSCAVGLLLAVFWWRTVTDAWVRSAATRYMTQFYETLTKQAVAT
jgi:hypothetical protein